MNHVRALVLTRHSGSFFRLNSEYNAALAKFDNAKEPYDPLSELEALILAPPVLYGFSVSDQRWCMSHISRTLDIGTYVCEVVVFSVDHVQPEYDGDIPGLAKYECDSSQAGHAEGVDHSIELPPMNIKAAGPAATATPSSPAERDTAAAVQRFCKEELSAFSVRFEERCVVRALWRYSLLCLANPKCVSQQMFAEVNAKYAAEYAIHRQIMVRRI